MTLDKKTLEYLKQRGFDVDNNIHYVDGEDELCDTLEQISGEPVPRDIASSLANDHGIAVKTKRWWMFWK